MPTLDSCHEQVVNALKKAGWDVASQAMFVRTPEVSVFIDIEALRNNGHLQQIVIIEVKCFTNENSDLNELYRAIGQYIIYRTALHERTMDFPLYLAIPTSVYERLFKTKIVTASAREIQMKLIVVDIDREEIVTWLD